MSTCAGCKVAFTGGIIVPCVGYNSLFHAYYSKNLDYLKKKNCDPDPDSESEGVFMNCAEINPSEKWYNDIIISKICNKKRIVIYKCRKCKEKVGMSLAVENLLTLVSTKLAGLDDAVKVVPASSLLKN